MRCGILGGGRSSWALLLLAMGGGGRVFDVPYPLLIVKYITGMPQLRIMYIGCYVKCRLLLCDFNES